MFQVGDRVVVRKMTRTLSYPVFYEIMGEVTQIKGSPSNLVYYYVDGRGPFYEFELRLATAHEWLEKMALEKPCSK